MPNEPNELSAQMKEALAKFECLSNPEQFKDHITNLFITTSQEISKTARSLTDAHNPYNSYTKEDLVFRSEFVELGDQIVRYANNELNKINGDGAPVPTVYYFLLWEEPEDWESNYTSYYILNKAGTSYTHVPSSNPPPEFENDKYYRKETSA